MRANQFQQLADEWRSRSTAAPVLAMPAPLGSGSISSSLRHVFDRNFYAQIESLGFARVHDRDGPIDRRSNGRFEFRERFVWLCSPQLRFDGCVPLRHSRSAQEARHFFQRTLRGGKTDSLQPAPDTDAPGVQATAPDANRAWSARSREFRPRSPPRPNAEIASLEVSSRYKDSGVVIRMSAGWRRNRARSAGGSVACANRDSTAHGTEPRRCAACAMPTSGARRLRSTSTASALIGEI